MSEDDKKVEVNVKPKGGLIAALVTGVLAIIMVAVIYFKLFKKGAKLARLQHDKEVANQEVAMAAADSLLAENEEEVNAALRRASEAGNRRQDIRAQIAQEKADREALRAEIAGLQSWDEVDAFVRRNR